MNQAEIADDNCEIMRGQKICEEKKPKWTS